MHLGKSSDSLWALSQEPSPASHSVWCKHCSGDRLVGPQLCPGVGSWHQHFPAALCGADGAQGTGGLFILCSACRVGALPWYRGCQYLVPSPSGSWGQAPCWEGQPEKIRGLGSVRSGHVPFTSAEVHWGEETCRSPPAGTDFVWDRVWGSWCLRYYLKQQRSEW